MEPAPNTSAVANALPAMPPRELFQFADAFIVNRCLFAVAKLDVADVLADGPRSAAEIARQLGVNDSALYRVLRALSSVGVFEESAPLVFRNNHISHFLRSGVPGSMRAWFIFGGSQFFFAPYGEILYSIETGKSAREKVFGTGAFEYLDQHQEQARIFDDAMTTLSATIGPAVAAAYDFSQWGSVMDVGGGNGILLASTLKAHPKLQGVLADLPHVLERARERGYLGGELRSRAKMTECDFFREVPSGCRAYVMKSVIHDWEDEKARHILANCRRSVPADGALLLVEWALTGSNQPSPGKIVDVAMLVLTGGKERTTEEYRELLASAGFRLNKVVPTPSGMIVIESLPA
ncbi:MAG TPA: methyltransferase [Candidatus Acidoferrales bacterium]|nr:methyltransferase [Candidatus Acidoferrales bacterium]